MKNLRAEYRRAICEKVMRVDAHGIPNNADKHSDISSALARGIFQRLGLRQSNLPRPILHASISCKWTIRSDRSQNARTEGLNLIRSRKGNAPHIVIVTAEPYPQRIASLALGTAVLEMLDILVSGKRLRDISDLPFDLAI